MTDCDSLYEHLTTSKMNSIENKRLGIDLMALRQLVWERSGERTQYIDHDSGDYPRWIDTSTMVADPLTKAMNADRLANMLQTGVLDLTPTPESLFIKEKNKVVRKNAREKKKNTTEHNHTPDGITDCEQHEAELAQLDDVESQNSHQDRRKLRRLNRFQ